MMMTVNERTSEVGLRMAIGATPNGILAQFLFEATLLTTGGWLIGIASAAIAAVPIAVASEWPLAIPFDALLASAAMVLIAGPGFGAIPARRASLLPPMEALRSR
jgi:ABC-type antimicrobial peptide transport system permease subunit